MGNSCWQKFRLTLLIKHQTSVLKIMVGRVVFHLQKCGCWRIYAREITLLVKHPDVRIYELKLHLSLTPTHPPTPQQGGWVGASERCNFN